MTEGPGVAELAALAAEQPESLLHVEVVPPRDAGFAAWPDWVPAPVRDGMARVGITEPWQHQVRTAEDAWAGQDVVIATGTASGKSIGYLLPALTSAHLGSVALNGRGATALYLAPTKALARDQLRLVEQLDIPGVRPAAYDGDTPPDERAWIRSHANYVVTNPDLLHFGLLPAHERWAPFLRALRFVVIDEVHSYRGVFGSHVANVLRRLIRITDFHGSQVTFIGASATVADPGPSFERLTGRPAAAVTADASPHGPAALALWEPPLVAGGNGEVRRPAVVETARLLADLVSDDVSTLAFVRSRRAAESVAQLARDRVPSDVANRIDSYRGGYLPEERRGIEADLRTGRVLGLATTSALELGVDVSGLDAVLVSGWPGTRASLMQQFGRAGRSGRSAIGVFVARDDPLDTYLVHHPSALFGEPVEATVLDPTNPVVLAPHLCAAAAELPLREAELDVFGDGRAELVNELVNRGLLRERPDGWYWTRRERATDLADLRGSGGAPVRIVESDTGRLLGFVDAATAQQVVHAGAVYLHRGDTFLVEELDEAAAVATAGPATVDYVTYARTLTSFALAGMRESQVCDELRLARGDVDVTTQVVSYQRRRVATGESLGEFPLELPERTLRTQGTWLVVGDELLSGIEDVAGAAHAAEHAAIGLLPLVATCDRWDIGGVSTVSHPDTGACTIVVYDGAPGGAGFSERGYRQALTWLTATHDAIAACECTSGCPSCVQSPKCGNGNHPLDKDGARLLLERILRHLS